MLMPDAGGVRTWSEMASVRALAEQVCREKEIDIGSLDGKSVFAQAEQGDPILSLIHICTSITFVMHETDAQVARTQLNAGEFADISSPRETSPRRIFPAFICRSVPPRNCPRNISMPAFWRMTGRHMDFPAV